MNQLSSTNIVHAPIDRVWQTIADVGSIAAWHPGVEESPVLSDNRTGLGAARRVKLYDGSTAVETVTEQQDGKCVTVVMSDHKMPLSYGAATFEVRADGSDRTVVTMKMDYEMKYGPIGWMLNALMLRRIMTQLLASVVAGLDYHLKTGEIVGKGWVAEA